MQILLIVLKSNEVSYQVKIGNPRIESESFHNVFSWLFFKAFSSRKLRGSNEWANFCCSKIRTRAN